MKDELMNRSINTHVLLCRPNSGEKQEHRDLLISVFRKTRSLLDTDEHTTD